MSSLFVCKLKRVTQVIMICQFYHLTVSKSGKADPGINRKTKSYRMIHTIIPILNLNYWSKTREECDADSIDNYVREEVEGEEVPQLDVDLDINKLPDILVAASGMCWHTNPDTTLHRNLPQHSASEIWPQTRYKV